MKLQRVSLTVAAALALGLASCSKNEPVTSNSEDADKAAISTAKTEEAAKAEAEKAAAAAKAEAAKVAEAASVETTKAAEAAKVEAAKADAAAKAEAARVADAAKVEAAKVEGAKAAEAAKSEAAKAADSARIQGLIDNTRSLVGQGKYTEAASALQQLGSEALNADQTTLVNALKEQVQKALAAQAAEQAVSRAGNLLKK